MLERNFRVNVMGLLYLAREVAPDMIKAGNGTILVTGNTSAAARRILPALPRPRQPSVFYRSRSRAISDRAVSTSLTSLSTP
jgi:NAD(P)-dependent dehydrogenase (short-subunit alcohol dehydrogenase family)